MKLLKFLPVALLTLTFMSASAAEKSPASPDGKQKVYVCSGKYSKSYHTHNDCDALGNCKGEILEMDVTQAKMSGHKLCGYCKKRDAAASGKKAQKKRKNIKNNKK